MSAEHVIVLGCDETNMNHVTRNAFYVALTRARRSLTLLACMEGGGAEGLHPFVHVLPDEHITVAYLKGDGLIPMDSIGELVDHLARWAYAKARAKEKAAKKQKEKKRAKKKGA
jgi:superfamily I DNA/RNA helicase